MYEEGNNAYCFSVLIIAALYAVSYTHLMDYKVVVTAEAEEDLNQFIQYLLFAKKNKQAAKNVLDDFENTIKKLKYVADSLKVCDNPRLQSLGYRRINFQQHRYFMLYRIENDVVYVDDIFHELQDYENRMI